jgi:hypothetical protein
MKNLVLSIFALILILRVFAQAPQGINYQAVVRNLNGTTINNSNVSL